MHVLAYQCITEAGSEKTESDPIPDFWILLYFIDSFITLLIEMM